MRHNKFIILFTYLFVHQIAAASDFNVGSLYFNILSENTVEVARSSTYTGDIVIPSTVNYSGINYTITAIGESAFMACSKLSSIELPNTIKTIKSQAFYNCIALETIELPNSISSIGNYAFHSCGLKSIKIPASLTYIQEGVFFDCQHLVSIELPNTLYAIGEKAFENCLSLKEIVLPNHLTSIGEEAFNYCSNLTSIILPASLKSIGKEAFHPSLKEVESKILEPFETYAFSSKSGGHHDRILYVPSGTKEKYVKCYGWGTFFKEIIEKANTYSLQITSTGNGSVTYNGTITKNGTNTFSVNEGMSATISFTPDNGYRIKSVKVNSTDITSSILNNQYTISNINQNTTIETEFEAIPVTTYTLSIKATGNGTASYNGTTVRSKTSTFTVNEGTSATITFAPDNKYRIKSVKVNNADVTSIVSNYKYTISSINKNTTVEVEFEAIPATTYTLSIKATGNGSVSYNGTTIRSKTSTFTVNEGTSATITFAPDNGYRIKSVKVNNTDVTSNVSNNKYTISSINKNTTVEVEFEAIPPTTYTLSIKATGSGSASYNGTTIRSKTSTFTLNEGTSATITFAPDNGYRIKSVKVNNADVTSNVSNNKYTISSINKNTTVEVEFEAIPPTTYTLSIKATGSGSASYNGTTIRSKTSTFTVNEGSSATIAFTPDNGYRIKSVKVNSSDVTANISNNKYTISSINKNTTVEVEFEAIPATTYTLSIKATGNGSASYNGTTIRSKMSTFTVNEGSSATITFTPDNGYRIKSVKENSTDVISYVSNNVYVVKVISRDTNIEVEFEAIPATTYTLSIKATGYGSVSYDGTAVRNQTSTFTVNEGTNATISISPDYGYQIKSVIVNNSDVTSYISNNSYTISNISVNTTVEVEFEVIPATTYTLSISAYGAGYAYYDGTTIRNGISYFTLNEGTYVTINITPDNGYRISSVKENGYDVTSSVWNNQYSIGSIYNNTTIEVEFEAIPVTTYSLSIKATGNGSASYNGTTIRNRTNAFTVNEGSSATITFTPDDGYRIMSVKVNSYDVTSSVSNNQYTISNISQNTTLEVEFAEELKSFAINGINYSVLSYNDRTVCVSNGSYGMVLEVPAKITYQNAEWTVAGIDNGALTNNPDLAAIIWNPLADFTVSVGNPNLLLYVKSSNYVPATINNVIVNSVADHITLTDATSGNNFYCPQEFTAKSISYTHNYGMITGIGESRGWETIAMPFDVQKITHSSKGEIIPFANWKSGDSKKPFWLMELGTSGFMDASAIKANTPYIISMPNNTHYKNEFRLNGNVTFSAENVKVRKSDNLNYGYAGDKTFYPNFKNQVIADVYALNVNNNYISYNGNEAEGSHFVYDPNNPRPLHPFEAYMTSTSKTRAIAILDNMTTGIRDIAEIWDDNMIRVYNLGGQLLMIEENKSLEEIKQLLSAGVYIVNGKKLIVR